MLFSEAEMNELRIVGMYKDAPAKMINTEIEDSLGELLQYGYLKLNKAQTSLRLTEDGAKILNKAGIPAKTEARSAKDYRTLARRLLSTEAALFLSRASLNVFLNDIPKRVADPIYLSTSELRRQNYANVLGMSKFIGLLYSETITYAVYNVTDPAETFFPLTDEEVFRREIISANNPTKIIYLGSSLNEMIESYAKKTPAKKRVKKKAKTDSSSVNFYQAIERFSVPVCFIPMDALGIHQIRIILSENYREKLTKYMLSVSYHSVLADFIDARYGNTDKYFIVFIDFDIKRLQTALRMVPKLDILVLKEQVPALKSFLNAPNARICSIKPDEAFEVLGIPPPVDKLLTPYISESEDNKCIFATRTNYLNGGKPIEKNI